MAFPRNDDLDYLDLPDDGCETNCPEGYRALTSAILQLALEDREALRAGRIPDVMEAPNRRSRERKGWRGATSWPLAAIDWGRFELAAFFTGKAVESLRNGGPPRDNYLDTFTELALDVPPDTFLENIGVDPTEEAKFVASYRSTGGWRPQGVYDLTWRHGRCRGWDGNGNGGRLPAK